MTAPGSVPSVRAIVVVGAVLLFLSYWAIFVFTTDDGVAHGAVQAANNAVPAVGLALIAHLALDRWVWPARPFVKVFAHLPLALGFALTWYLTILVVRALQSGSLEEGLFLRPFVPIAFVWQMFQGVTFYALTAVSSLALALTRELAAARSVALPEPDKPASDSLLIRTADGAENVAPDTIVSISGAGDYSEIVLPGRTILSATTLAEFEARLPPGHFIRAHRSHIVRLSAIERSEPAGNGRTVLHLVDGRNVTTSRAGTRVLREAAL